MAKNKRFLEKLIPQLVNEVSTATPAPSTRESVSTLPVKSATKRENDLVNLEKDISHYLQGIVELRNRYANRLYFLLCFEIVVMFIFVALYGTGYLKLEAWLVTIIAETILAKTFLTVQTIVKNLFPSKDLLGLILDKEESR